MIDYILGFAILLGVLIFIHEFGHFIVAKACGVRVETFSIGMGKKFIRFTKGDTEYALSLLPLGGYVKLTGQDPREEVAPEHKAGSFREKALWQRAAIVLAGPFFNAALAVFVFIGLYHVGVPVQAPVLVHVLPDSPAEKAGFRSGDKVLAIAHAGESPKRARELADLESMIGDSADQPLNFFIERKVTGEAADEQSSAAGTALQKTQILFTPLLGPERDSTVGVMRERGVIPGVEYHEAGPVISVDSHSWTGSRGLLSNIWVEELHFPMGGVEETEKIESYSDLERAWAKAESAQAKSATGRVILKARKISLAETSAETAKTVENPLETFELSWNQQSQAMPPSLAKAGIASAELEAAEVKAGSPAEKLGLKAGDRIVKLNEAPVYSFLSFRNVLQKDAASGHELRIGWFRDGTYMESSVKPELVSTTDPLTEAKKNQFQIGAMFLPTQAPPPEAVLKGEGLADTVSLGLHKTAKLTASMLESFWLLAKGDISPKTLGGPILIGKIAGESFKAGAIPFFRMIAFISMNLCVLNLFPIPVLDGGHLLLYCIEAVRRKPLSLKIVEIWTTAGFFLLMGLVAVVFFNDLSRLGLFKFLKL